MLKHEEEGDLSPALIQPLSVSSLDPLRGLSAAVVEIHILIALASAVDLNLLEDPLEIYPFAENVQEVF